VKAALGAALFFVAMCADADARSCLHDGDSLTGEIRDVQTKHPGNGMLLSSRFLVVPEKVCVESKDLGFAEGRWIQIVLLNQSDLPKLVLGDSATIKANYDVPVTAYHLGDIMAFNAEIISVSSP
jgi:hypothetical protein